MMKNLLVAALLMFPTSIWAGEALAVENPAADDRAAEGQDSGSKGKESKNLLKPTNDVESWTLELTDDGKGEMKVDGDAIVFKTTKTTGTDWHVQAYQTGLDLKDGQDYVVKFQMKSPDKVALLLVGQIHQDDWHEIGLHEEIQPEKDYKEYKYEFTANDTADKNNRIGFVLGIDKGEVSVKDLTLMEKKTEKK